MCILIPVPTSHSWSLAAHRTVLLALFRRGDGEGRHAGEFLEDADIKGEPTGLCCTFLA
jgi:hypothetical protein